MTFTFVSNYINHHQIPFCEAMREKLGEGFAFIQTMPMEQERKDMGWGVDLQTLPYVFCLYEDEYHCKKKIMESDVVLFGWTGREDLVASRLDSKKLTLRVSERLYREGQWKAVSPRGLVAKYREHIKYRKQNVCMLCAGAYTASDFKLIGAYPGKMFKWGYFPKLRTYEPGSPCDQKPKDGPLEIVWAGRLIALKHPEYVIRLAGRLQDEGYDFRIHLLGDGEMMPALKSQAKQAMLDERIVFYGYASPDKVRDVMEKCHIHLFTSNYLEGWGAVVNEGMNSGCVEVVSARVGAAPYLIEHGKNGLVYPDDCYEKMESLMLDLFAHWENYRQMGQAAYETICKQWNAEHAAKELLSFVAHLKDGKVVPAANGPMSVAKPIAPKKMYKAMLENKL